MTNPILPLTALVTTPETSERLRDAGLRARSLCAWVYPLGKDERRLAVPWDWERGATDAYFDPLPACTVAELGALLPPRIAHKRRGYVRVTYPRGVYYRYHHGDDLAGVKDMDNAAEMHGLLFLALHERGLLPPESYGVVPERTQDPEDA